MLTTFKQSLNILLYTFAGPISLIYTIFSIDNTILTLSIQYNININ